MGPFARCEMMSNFRRPFVKGFALCCRIVVCLYVCLSCLSVTLVYCGQTVGWIRMARSKDRPRSDHIVLDGDPASLPERGGGQHGPHLTQCGQERGRAAPPFFGPCLLWPNGRPIKQPMSSCTCYTSYKLGVKLSMTCNIESTKCFFRLG